MKVSGCVLLFVCLAYGQKSQGPPVNAGPQHPPPPPPPTEPVAPPGAASSANPWHELLHKMMMLIETAATSTGAYSSGQPSSGQPSSHPVGSVETYTPSPTDRIHSPPPTVPTPPIAMVTKPPTQPPTQPQTQPPTQPPTRPPRRRNTTPKPKPVMRDCFWESRYYRPGSDIVRGQHDRWCYVTYCDSNGKIQFWDDYNCPLNSMKPTSDHNSGVPGRQQPTPPPVAQAAPLSPGGPQRGGGAATVGCHQGGVYYEPGQEIDTNRVGKRCHGTYCSDTSQITQWEDWCQPSATQAPAPRAAPTAGHGPASAGSGHSAPGPGPVKGPGPAKSPAPVQGNVQRGGGGGGGGGGGRRGGQNQGCYHNDMYYQPNEDVIVGNIGDLCYGYYCEGRNTFVHWEDRCAPTTIPPPAAPNQRAMYF